MPFRRDPSVTATLPFALPERLRWPLCNVGSVGVLSSRPRSCDGPGHHRPERSSQSPERRGFLGPSSPSEPFPPRRPTLRPPGARAAVHISPALPIAGAAVRPTCVLPPPRLVWLLIDRCRDS